MANTAEQTPSVPATIAVIVAEHQVEVHHKEALVGDVRADIIRIDADIFKNQADTERVGSGGGWRSELFPGIVGLSAAFEWPIASVVAQTFFGSSRVSLVVLTCVFTLASVGVGWFLGRILREQRAALREGATERIMRITVLAVIVGLVVAGYILRLQASGATGLVALLTTFGQALATSMLSAGGVVVATGFEYYREDPVALELRRELAKLRHEKYVAMRRLARATAELRQAERGFALMRARAGMPDDAPPQQPEQDIPRRASA